MTPSKDDFRRVAGRFATGVTIVTTRHGDHLHGMTANAVTSVSLEPLLVLVCVDKTADTHDILAQTGFFAVNILGREQQDISVQFAQKKAGWSHGLHGLPHRFAVTGAPIIWRISARFCATCLTCCSTTAPTWRPRWCRSARPRR